MHPTPLYRSAAPLLFGILALGGCTSSQTLTPPANATDQVRAIDRSKRSWIDPAAAKAKTLLYVSNSTSKLVTIYSYDNGSGIALVGELAGFSRPEGLCSDQAGDVWVTDFQTRRLTEYAHGATTPSRKIQQSAGQPSACAVDPNTGNLASANRLQHYYREGDGEITIYEKHPARRVHYQGGLSNSVLFSLAYDDKSDLFADASETFYTGTGFYELLNGANYFEELTVPGSRSAFGGLAWANPALLMASYRDYYAASISKLEVSGYNVQVIQTLPLSQTQAPILICVRAGKIIVPDSTANAVEIYNLKDGSFLSSFTDDLSGPYSAVISQKG
jgi:hypothetical protein